jgi:S1-C subfamily serine protease
LARTIITIIVWAFLGLVVGCARLQPIYNVGNAQITTRSGKTPALEDVAQGIKQTAERRGWVVSDETPGHMVAIITVDRSWPVRQSHMAAVDIAFNPSNYSITYKYSSELLWNGAEIHRNYNKWVKLLEQDINARLYALGDGTASRRSVAARSAPAQRRLDSTGTGFAVSEDGQIVTNHHVVADCAEVRVRPPGREALAGAVVAQDARNDLALLKAPVRLPVAAIGEDRGIRAGDSVVAVGFPLPGLLASEVNVTTGTVSALAGIANDTRFLQMTVPVQPGNSGGPLLDLEGRVVGVVVGKLDALKVASVTGDIPQNVNFAIKASVLRSFLDASGAAVARREPLAEPAYAITLSPAAVGADAKAFTVLVECWK